MSRLFIGNRTPSEVLREYMSLFGSAFRKRIVVSSAPTCLWTIPSDCIGHEICVSGWYEEPCLWAAEYLIRNGLASRDDSVLVDVGANIGVYTVRLAQMFERVVAFEPSPLIAQALQLNICYNGLSNVTVRRVGLSDVEKPMNYHYVTGNLGASHVTSREAAASGDIIVQLVRGDDTIGESEGNVSYLKIDVEGHELQVLRGLVETIRRCRPIIQFELFETSEATVREVEVLLNGYSFFMITTQFGTVPRFIRAPIQLVLGKKYWLVHVASMPRCSSEAVFAVPSEMVPQFQ